MFLKQMREYEKLLQVFEGLDRNDKNFRASWPLEGFALCFAWDMTRAHLTPITSWYAYGCPLTSWRCKRKRKGDLLVWANFFAMWIWLVLDNEWRCTTPAFSLYPVTEHDDWWEYEVLLKQVKERALLRKQAFFAFDNATDTVPSHLTRFT